MSEDWLVICAFEHVHHFGWEFCEANLDRFSQVFRGVVKFARKITAEEYMAARRRRFEYVRELDLLLGADAVLLTPTNCVLVDPGGRHEPGDRGRWAIRRMRSTPIRRT